MCDTCNVPLNIAESPRADQERAEIRRLIAQGLTKQQILAELKRTYGPSILAKPQDSGFSLAVWWVPVAVVARARRPARRAAAALAAAIAGRRRARGAARGRPSSAQPMPGASTRTWRGTTSDAAAGGRPARHDRHRGLRRRLRLVRLAVRAAARPRLPVGGLRRQRHRHARRPPHACRTCWAPRSSSACRSR